jgi:hypothetical protein
MRSSSVCDAGRRTYPSRAGEPRADPSQDVDAFALARREAEVIDKAIERPFTYNVRLAKAR